MTTMPAAEVGQLRYRQWWSGRPLVRSLDDAGAFVGEMGLAVLFPSDDAVLPSLYEAAAGPDTEPFADGMAEPESLVWEWKDQLPERGLAWYGRLVHGRASLLAPDLLSALYPGDGGPDDHRALSLSEAAHQLAALLAPGPQPSSVLRAELGRRRYERAVAELHRQLLVTSCGVQQRAHGWPSAVLELTCRLFEVGGRRDPDLATHRFLATAVEASAADLAHAFGWPLPEAADRLNRLADTGTAGRDGTRFRIRRPPAALVSRRADRPR